MAFNPSGGNLELGSELPDVFTDVRFALFTLYIDMLNDC